MSNISYEIATKKHVDMMHEIETQSFLTPWSHKSMYDDVVNNDIATYLIALDGDKVIGYLGFWAIIDQAHITTIAIKKQYRRQNIANTMFHMIFDVLIKKEIHEVTLEVRESNVCAIKLYEKLGFYKEGFRKNYYTDTGEDAIIMWKTL